MMKEREADKKELKEIKQAQTRANEQFERGKLQYDKDQAEKQRRMNHEAASRERQEAASGSKTKWSERREVQSQISRSMKEQELEWYKNSGCKSF